MQAGSVSLPAAKPAQRCLIRCKVAVTWDLTHVLQQEVTVEGETYWASCWAG